MNKKVDLLTKLVTRKRLQDEQVAIRTTKQRKTNKLRKSAKQEARRRMK